MNATPIRRKMDQTPDFAVVLPDSSGAPAEGRNLQSVAALDLPAVAALVQERAKVVVRVCEIRFDLERSSILFVGSIELFTKNEGIAEIGV